MFSKLTKVGALASLVLSCAVSNAETIDEALTISGNLTAKGKTNGIYNGLSIYTGSTTDGRIVFSGNSTTGNKISSEFYLNWTPLTLEATSYNFTKGNVGIGVEKPTSLLHVGGDINCDGNLNIKGKVSSLECTDRAKFNDGAIVSGTLVATLTDHEGYPGSITMGGTKEAVIAAKEYCGNKSCPKDLTFDGNNYYFKNGNVGIGVASPTAKLHVGGNVICEGEFEVQELASTTINVEKLNAKDIRMNMSDVADYVFAEDYNLKSLSEVENYVNEHKHLPGVPSAAEMEAEGISVSKMSNLLLEKVEELTLHMIQLEKENAALKLEMENMKNIK